MKHEKIEVPEGLFRFSQPALVKVDPRRPFREAGQGLDEVFYVCSGLLAIYRSDGVGKRSIVALKYPNDAILPATLDCRLAIRAIVQSSVAVSKAGIGSMDVALDIHRRELAIANEWLVRQQLDAEARVAHLLCETAIRLGTGISGMDCPFNQAHIGEITGQTSVNVNRVLADFERRELLERKHRAFTFLDWDELARLGQFRADYLGNG